MKKGNNAIDGVAWRRFVAKGLSQRLSQQVMVYNKTCASDIAANSPTIRNRR